MTVKCKHYCVDWCRVTLNPCKYKSTVMARIRCKDRRK